LRLLLTGGEQADCLSAPELLKDQPAQALIADRGYDTNALRTLLAGQNIKAVIPTKSNRLVQIPHDKERPLASPLTVLASPKSVSEG